MTKILHSLKHYYLKLPLIEDIYSKVHTKLMESYQEQKVMMHLVYQLVVYSIDQMEILLLLLLLLHSYWEMQ
jgi:hypothetical protein